VENRGGHAKSGPRRETVINFREVCVSLYECDICFAVVTETTDHEEWHESMGQ
jgi:hypothetical protein